MPIYLEYAIARSYKKICGFSGLRPMRPCVSGDISRTSSRIFPATPNPRLPGGRLKSRKYKKSAVGGKKSPANAGTKRDYLFFYRQVLNRWNNTISCFFTANGGLFLRPTAAFWPMPAVVVMRSMALGVAATTKRETRFPTGVTDSHKKAKPTTGAMAFCVYINLLHK